MKFSRLILNIIGVNTPGQRGIQMNDSNDSGEWTRKSIIIGLISLLPTLIIIFTIRDDPAFVKDMHFRKKKIVRETDNI